MRVPVSGRDEFARLGRAFNAMANQLQARLEELDAERSRLREVTSRFGEALAATHDADTLQRAMVETAVEATGRRREACSSRRRARSSRPATPRSGRDRLELPLPPAARASARSSSSAAPSRTSSARRRRRSSATRWSRSRTRACTGSSSGRRSWTASRASRTAATATTSSRPSSRAPSASAQPLALVFADLDDFKRVNDRYGHPVGDSVLREFARRCAESVRDIDIAGRWGGEEFALILPGHRPRRRRARRRARSARPRLEPDARPGRRADPAAASFGVAALPGGGHPAELVAAADGALYAAKRAGKNRVVTAVQRTPSTCEPRRNSCPRSGKASTIPRRVPSPKRRRIYARRDAVVVLTGHPGPSRAEATATPSSSPRCRSTSYKAADPFENHPLFKTEEQARLEETMDGQESLPESPELGWPGEDAVAVEQQPVEADAGLWSRSRDFDWGD